MQEGVTESLLTVINVLVFMILLGLALTFIVQISGSGGNPGIIERLMEVFAGAFVRLGG